MIINSFKYVLGVAFLMSFLSIKAYDVEIDGLYYDINVIEKTATVT